MTGPADGSLIGPAGGSLPGVRELRRRLRRLRRPHRTGRTADLLTDGYLVVLLIGMYAGIAWPVLHRQLVSPAQDGPAAAGAYRAWLVAAVVVVFTGGAWHGLRALGPLLVRPPVLSWCLTSPVRRAGWLRPWLLGLLAVGAVGGALTMIGAAGATLTARPWAYAVPGAAAGLTLTAAAVAAQARPATRHASGAAVGRRVGRPPAAGRAGALIAAVGVGLAALVVAAHAAGVPLAAPSVPRVAVAVPAVLLAVGSALAAVRGLPRMDRVALSGGVRLAEAMTTAAVFVDVSLLSGLLEVRHWQRVAQVRGRALRRTGRTGVLLQADLRRQARRPAGAARWAALLLVPYACALLLPDFVHGARLVTGYLAVGGLAAGLRALCRSAVLRRTVGGSDRAVVAAHLVLPGVAVVLWWLLTMPAVGPLGVLLDLLLPAGVLGAVLRGARRPPMAYDGLVLDTPAGLIPADLVRQAVRGPDLVAVLVLGQVLLA